MSHNYYQDSSRLIFALRVLVALGGAALVISAAPGPAMAQKNKPGGTTYTYTLTDLLGFPDQGYQSQGQFITNRDSMGQVLVLGPSRLFPDAQGPAIFHPALWRIGPTGTFPATDPVDLGLPPWAREVVSTGLNRFGISVGRPTWLIPDANGNLIESAYVCVPGQPYQEILGGIDRNASATAINDAGEIVGTIVIADSSRPRGVRGDGALWKMNPDDGSIGAPVSLGSFYPFDINNYGVMAGMIDNYPAIGWMVGTELVTQKMAPSPRFLNADLHAVNDCPIGDPRLTVVGYSFSNDANQYDAADSNRAIVWRPYDAVQPMTVLGTLGGKSSCALDVNRVGQIVGWSFTRHGDMHAFVYANGRMTDLNVATNVGTKALQSAMGVNDSGDIVGFMQIPRPVSEQHGYLLRPLTSP